MFLGELMDDGPPWVRKSIQNTLWLAEQRLFPFILKGFLPPLWDKIVQIASSKEVVFLLELGCGHCGLLAKLAQRCKSSGIPCVFVAVDVEPSAIEGSKNKLLARGFSVHLAERLEEVDLARLAGLAKREKNPIICLVQADVYKLEKVFAPDVIFDFAWLHHFFHHLPDEGARSLIGEVEGFATSWYVLEELRQWLPLFLIHIFIWYFPAHLETAVNSILAEKTKQEWKDEWPGTEMCTKGFLVFINNAVELPVAVDETKLVIVGK
jgi:SAM-dependent methyltransferase